MSTPIVREGCSVLRAATCISLGLASIAFIHGAAGESSIAPHISHTFPPAEDVRRPDRTIHDVAAGSVAVVAYDPPGRALATAGEDGAIRLWDARTGEQGTGELLRTFIGHTGLMRTIAFSADGKTLVSVGSDQTLRIWDVATGDLQRQVPLKITSRSIALHASPQPYLAWIAGAEVRVWDFEHDELLRSLPVPTDGEALLVFSADGQRLAYADHHGTVRVWDLTKGSTIAKWEAGASAVSLAIDRLHVAVGRNDGRVKVAELGGGSPVELRAAAGAISAVTFNPAGDQLATADAEGAVKVWDVGTGTLLCVQSGARAVSVAFSANGQKMAWGGQGGIVCYGTVPLPPIQPAELDQIKAALPGKATVAPKRARRLLVFWRADAILHKGGVPAANHAIELLGLKTHAFTADFARDYEVFDRRILASYDAIVMNSTAHLVMPEAAKEAYLDYAKNGGGIVGVHAAIDMFRDWPEGAAVIGATFANHPWPPTGTWAVKLEDPADPMLRAWGGKNFKIRDEFYEMGEPYTRADRRVLLTVDMSDPVTAGVSGLHRQDRDFALAWIKRYGEGRVFYCNFGHIVDPFRNPMVLQFYLDGIQYAVGDLEADAAPKVRP